MEIKTKYDIGERVYVLKLGRLYDVKIVDIRISSDKNHKEITYKLNYKWRIFEADESDIFSSKEDFLDFAKNIEVEK